MSRFPTVRLLPLARSDCVIIDNKLDGSIGVSRVLFVTGGRFNAVKPVSDVANSKRMFWFGWMFYHYPQFEQAHLAKAVIFTLTGFMIMQLLLSAKHHLEAFARHALLSRIVSWLSQISYSLYLIHLFIFSYGATMGWPVGITLPLVIVSSLAAASLMYYLFEVAIVLKLRRWLEHRWLAGT